MKKIFAVLIFFAVALGWVSGSQESGSPSFFLNGEPCEVQSVPGHPNLVSLGRLLLNLREKRSRYDLRIEGSGEVFTLRLGEKCIGWSGSPPVGVDSDSAWGVLLAGTQNFVPNPETAVTLDERAGRAKPGQSLETLPPGLRYLSLGNQNVALLAGQSDLRFLSVTQNSIDVNDLLQASHLTGLELVASHLEHTEKLSELASLRTLSVACPELQEVSWLERCLRLEHLRLELTKVEDLRVLGSLPSLCTVSAAGSRIRHLPTMVKWSHLDLLGCGIPEASLRSFKTAHPHCEVWSDEVDPLKSRLAPGVSRLRVRDGGTCHVNLRACKTLFETSDFHEIQDLLDGLSMVNREAGPVLAEWDIGPTSRRLFGELNQCMCCGGPSLEFYRGQDLVLTLGNQHGSNLRWVGGPWLGDACLTVKGREFFIAWLAKRGVKGPLNEVRRGEAGGRELTRKEARAARGFPPALLERGRVCLHLEEKLKSEVSEPSERLRLHLQVLGASNDNWIMWSGSDSCPRSQDYDQAWLKREVWRWLPADDPVMRRGAARFVYVSDRFSYMKWTPQELADARPYLIQAQFTSFRSLRLEAVEELEKYWAALAAPWRSQLLELGLCDPDPTVRSRCCKLAAKVNFGQAEGYLRAMSAGKPEIRKMPFDLEMDAFDGAPVEDDQAAAREALESLNNSKTR